jgi:hypothetical protein
MRRASAASATAWVVRNEHSSGRGPHAGPGGSTSRTSTAQQGAIAPLPGRGAGGRGRRRVTGAKRTASVATRPGCRAVACAGHRDSVAALFRAGGRGGPPSGRPPGRPGDGRRGCARRSQALGHEPGQGLVHVTLAVADEKGDTRRPGQSAGASCCPATKPRNATLFRPAARRNPCQLAGAADQCNYCSC